VISPLLSNVALHGMGEMLKDWIETIRAYNPGGTILSKAARRSRLTVVRFADDFVVPRTGVREARTKISTWLSAMGLELHPDKTSIRHTFLAQPAWIQIPGWIRNSWERRRRPRGSLDTGLTYGHIRTISPEFCDRSRKYSSLFVM
jgi:hypothetical protein